MDVENDQTGGTNRFLMRRVDRDHIAFSRGGTRNASCDRLRTAVCTAPLRREPTRLRCILVAGQNSRYSLCLVYYKMADAAGEGTCMPHHGSFLK